ncbi:MAG: hypothetical protein AVDCRST_MAG59-3079, partial [uncultured Thermomicrobiales bacterium]
GQEPDPPHLPVVRHLPPLLRPRRRPRRPLPRLRLRDAGDGQAGGAGARLHGQRAQLVRPPHQAPPARPPDLDAQRHGRAVLPGHRARSALQQVRGAGDRPPLPGRRGGVGPVRPAGGALQRRGGVHARIRRRRPIRPRVGGQLRTGRAGGV